jgi:hypothetical protein
MTTTEKLITFLEERERNNFEIKNASSIFLVQSYYKSLGLDGKTTVNDWFIGLATKKYPHYSSVTRAIRKARELNPRWKKDREKKETEINNFEKEVGYK